MNAVYIRYELLRTFRNRRFFLFAFGFPLVLYFLIAGPNRHVDSLAGTGISAFVITLAGLSVFKGINLGITRAQPFYGIPDSVKAFGATTVAGPIPWIALPT